MDHRGVRPGVYLSFNDFKCFFEFSKFINDDQIIKVVYSSHFYNYYYNRLDGPSHIDIVWGIPWKCSGADDYYIDNVRWQREDFLKEIAKRLEVSGRLP